MGGSCVLILLLSLWFSHHSVTAQAEECRTAVQADVVFLVDESWSVGQTSFSRVKEVVSALVSSFNRRLFGAEGVRFGVTVFGDVPRMRIALTDYSTMDEVLRAIRDLPYEGGQRRIGLTLQSLVDAAFGSAVSRDNTPKVAVLITNGRSDDAVDAAARTVSDNGISLYAVGVGGADESELRRIVSLPHEEHLLMVSDFSLLDTVLPKLSRRVCFTASEPPRPVKTLQPEEQPVVGPRDLQVSEVAHDSLRLTWSRATGDVSGYRVLVTPLSSRGQLVFLRQRQLDLKADLSTELVTDLNPKTGYSFTVYAIYPNVIGDSATITAQTTPLPQVSNFRVIEEGLFSLRLGWTPPRGRLNGYKIFIPRSNRPGFSYEQQLPPDSSSHVIDSLEEDKKFTVSIYAVYPQGPSLPVSVVGKTLKLVPVKTFLVQNATTDTVQARWSSVKGASGYRLTWASPDGHIENVNLRENFNFYMIQGLHAGAEYTITMNPIFGDIEGPVTTTTLKTLESSAVQTLKVSAVTTSSAVVSWNSVPGATGYRLAYGPTHEFTGRDRPRQLALNGSTTEYQLKNVAHDTEYVLTLYVLFGPVVGPGITATFRTSPLGYVSNFKVSSYTSTTIDLEWSPIVGATEYKLTWKSGDDKAQSRYLDGHVLNHRIEDLNPQSTYSITIGAVYGNSEGPEISLSQLTAAVSGLEPIQPVRDVKAVDIGVNFFTLSWRKSSGATGYKVSWIPFLGGEEKSHIVPADSNSFTIKNVRESSAFKIQVAPMVGARVGSPVLLTARTLDLPKVNSFTALDVTDRSVVLNWTRVAEVSGYLLTWRHISVLETKTETLGPAFSSYKVQDLLYGRTYIFSIRPLYGEVQGPITTVYQRIVGKDSKVPPAKPVSATAIPPSPRVTSAAPAVAVRTTAGPTIVPQIKTASSKKPTGQPRVTEPENTSGQISRVTAESPTVCGKSKSDIVFLVDESSSIGVNNFNKIKDFMFRVATYFPVIGPKGAQIAVVHYSDEPRVEFKLNDYKDRNSILRALRGLRYAGGNTKTGKGINYVLQELFQESLGMRQNVAHVLVLITDGRAQDNVEPPSRIARALGVSILAVGVSNADLYELNRIAAPTSYRNIFYSPTFDDFPSIERDFVNSICSDELLNEFKLPEDEIAQLDTPTEDPEQLQRPEGPCPCVKGAKGEKGDGSGLGGLRFRPSPGQVDPFKPVKGERGEKGPSGTDGIPGLPGRPGRTGPPGSVGLRGSPGVPGEPGIPGLTGPKGQRGERGDPGYVVAGADATFIPGRKGEPGSSGPRGPVGIPGANGSPGLLGHQGPQGPPGLSIKGDTGEKGETGFRGDPGFKGDKGEPGKDGLAGLPGPIGIDGVAGLPGQKGQKGEGGIGIQGVQGARGEPGEKGNVGFTGPVGPKGDRGEQGLQGELGPRGKKGQDGERGEKGDKGEIGPIGPRGPTGLTGPLGLKGDEGQRGFPGDPAKGILGPTGKKGVRGDIGPVGPKGDLGVKGEQGIKGEKGSPGFGIPGQRGPKGENGERGNVGLSGKPGPKGQDAAKGVKGNTGLPGKPGDPGLRGKDGAPGSKGDSGLKGEQGPRGEPGDIGIRGPLGLPGRPGDAGEKGDAGNPGKLGVDGKKGERGDPGKPGPPGIQAASDNILTRVIKGEPGEPGQPGLGGEPGIAGPRGPEGKPGLPGASLAGSGKNGLPGKPGPKGDEGKRGEPGQRGEKGEQGRVGIVGIPGLPGTPGKPGIDGKRGQPGKDGENGERGVDGKKGDKGDAGVDGKNGSKGDQGSPGLPGRQVLVTPDGATVDDVRQAFPIPMGPPGATGSPGMKGDKGETGLTGDKGEPGAAGKTINMKDIEAMFEDYGIRLPLLKTLINRLLQDGIEELLHVLVNSMTDKEDGETSNVIAENTSFGKFDTSNKSLLESPTKEDQQAPGGLKADTATHSPKQMNTETSSHHFPLSPDQQMVTETPDTVLVPPEDPKKNPGQKKNKERGKGKGKKGRPKRQRHRLTHEQDEEADVEDYDDEDDVIHGESPLAWERTDNMQDTVTHSPNQMNTETSSQHFPLSPDQQLNTQDLPLPPTTEEPNKVPGAQSRVKRSDYSSESSRSMPGVPGGKRQSKMTQSRYQDSGAPGHKIMKPEIRIQSKLPSDTRGRRQQLIDGHGDEVLGAEEDQLEETLNLDHTDPTKQPDVFEDPGPDYEEEATSGDYESGTGDVDRETDLEEELEMERERERLEMEQEREELEREKQAELEKGKMEEALENERWREEWERRRVEIERQGERDYDEGAGHPYPPQYYHLKGQPGEDGGQGPKGEIGEKGQKGEPGIGHRGPEGQAGLPGQKGEPGEPGPPGAQGIQGIRGNAGFQGSPGVNGHPGDPGGQGRDGNRGKRGKTGSHGPPGPVGAPGPLGPPGVPGVKGEKGDSVPGQPGARGLIGLPGFKGVKGTPGVKGALGHLGLKGFRGSKGEKGDRGVQGFRGDRGSTLQIQGPPGLKGAKGNPGDRGPPGFDGDKGEKGEDGPPGVKGLKGDAGTKGTLGRFGARGPVGQKGDPGEPGINGVKGRDGRHGVDGAKGDNGDIGMQGQKGNQGDSGEQGLPGEGGGRGEKGFRGFPGHSGAPGFDGEKGEMGLPGTPGLPGLNGLPGHKAAKGEGGVDGADGEPGEKGEKGATGFSGFPGFKGSTGSPGTYGNVGLPGPPGLRGGTGQKGERGRRGRVKPCQRGSPGTPGQRGDRGSVGTEGSKGDKGEPGLSAFEVKTLVAQEVVQKCGTHTVVPALVEPFTKLTLPLSGMSHQESSQTQCLEYKFMVKSVDPDALAPVKGENAEPDDEVLPSADVMEEKDAENETLTDGVEETQSPAPMTLVSQTDSSESGAVMRRRRAVLGSKPAGPARCLEPMSEGACSEFVLLWYFHLQSGKCRPFVFGGCGGTQNRFSSHQECQEVCTLDKRGVDAGR